VKRALPLCCLLLLTACPDPAKPDAGPAVCDVTLPDQCTQTNLRWADVKPLFDRHCVPCHYGQVGGPWPMQTYSDVADWADVVRGDIAFCSMPPADAGTLMTNEERRQILDWLRCDFPQ
jgi:hypothetical protein